jgi:3-keto-5-aminohexanoate cleavage enzyme
MGRKVIVTCSLVGSGTRKNQNPNTPYTPQELAESAHLAYEAGAAMVHMHAIEDDGTNSVRLERVVETYEAIKAKNPELIINVTTGMGRNAVHEQRIAPIRAIKPEIASLNVATMNFAAINRKTGEVVDDFTFENPLNVVADFARTMKEVGTKIEIEVYCEAGIDNYYFLAPSGYFSDPVIFNFVWGVCGGASFRPASFVGMVNALPPGAVFTACGVGSDSWPAITQSILCGGNVRIGLEDVIRMPNGELAKGNYELVENAVRIIRALGREPATPDEARAILGIKKK